MNDPAAVGTWVLVASQVLGFVWILVKLSGRSEKREITPSPLVVKPEPEYAERGHAHPEYISREECRTAHLAATQAETTKIEQVQRQLDFFIKDIKQALQKHNEQAEGRAAVLHARIDPISNLAQSTTDRLNDHFEDHRNGRFHSDT